MPDALLRHNAGTIAIIASVHDAFRADVERPSACERAVELAVILLLQRGFQRWRIWNRLQHFPMFILHARVGVRTDPVVPIDLQGGHLAAGRNLPADDAPLGILFLAAAGFVQAFDACRMTGPKGPEDAVKIMAAPIAQGAGAEVPIIAPVGRVQARVVVAVGRRSQPLVPVQARGRRARGWPSACSAIDEPVPTVRFNHITDGPCPKVLAEPPVALATMALVAHLRDDLGLPGGLRQGPHSLMSCTRGFSQ